MPFTDPGRRRAYHRAYYHAHRWAILSRIYPQKAAEYERLARIEASSAAARAEAQAKADGRSVVHLAGEPVRINQMPEETRPLLVLIRDARRAMRRKKEIAS